MLKFTKPDLSWIEKGFAGLMTFGKKNKTSLMTGSGIVIGWLGVYLFWQESKKAEEIIRKTEERLTNEAREKDPEAEPVQMEFKEKFMIYAGCCWPSAICGVASTALPIASNKISMDEIAKGYVMARFFQNQNAEKDREIEKLKEEIPEKKLKKITHDLEEEHIRNALDDRTVEETGYGRTLFADKVHGIYFRSSITEVQKQLYAIRDEMRERRTKQIQKRLGSAFYVSDNPFPDDLDIYVEMGLDDFYKRLGYKRENSLGEVLEVRDYGFSDFLDPTLVMDYKDYTDPETGEAAMCILRLKENQFVWPTIELQEQTPNY